jgi:hypothetical protein
MAGQTLEVEHLLAVARERVQHFCLAATCQPGDHDEAVGRV